MRNVAAPKANEESQAAPRMLKLTLTDGHSFCQGIEVESIPQISIDRTAPGAKILLKNAQIKSGYILLHPGCCTYLGGKVSALYEKWEVSRSLLKNNRRRTCKFGCCIVEFINRCFGSAYILYANLIFDITRFCNVQISICERRLFAQFKFVSKNKVDL